MKKIGLLLFYVLCFFKSYSQEKIIESQRTFIKNTINAFFVDKDGVEYNAYTDVSLGNLNIDVEIRINVTKDQLIEINGQETLKERSKDLVYKISKELNRLGLLKMSKQAEYGVLVWNITYITNDYQYVKNQFSANTTSLSLLSDNLNRNSFNKILYHLN